jgi:subtilisin family serine protease
VKTATIATILLLAASTAHAGYVSQTLVPTLETAAPDEGVECLVQLADQVDIPALRDYLIATSADRDEMHTTCITMLQQKAATTQEPLRRWLETEADAGRVFAFESFWIFNGFYVRATPDAIREIASRSDVGIVAANARAALEKPEDVRPAPDHIESVEWNLEMIKADSVWAMGYTGAGRIVCGIDTGVDYTHPALNASWHGNFVPHSQAWLSWTGGGTTPHDNSDHGTHTMGSMCGVSPTGDTVGVAIGAHWIASDPLYASGGSYAAEITTFQWAADPDSNPGTTDDVPDAVNCSWWQPQLDGYLQCNPDPFFTAMEALELAGCAIIFSAGNSGPGASTITAPKNRIASAYDAWATGNIQSNYVIRSSSSRGPSICDDVTIKPEVCAPGTNIRSSVPGGNYSYMSGTSMAAPHVSGSVAVLREIDPTLTTYEVKEVLFITATDLGDPGEDNSYGNGLIDLKAAAEYVIAHLSAGFVEGTVTDTVGSAIQGATVNVRDGGGSAITNTSGYYIAHGDTGQHWVVVDHSQYEMDSALVNFVIHDTTTQDFVLQPLGTGELAGMVRDSATSLAIEGAIVEVLGLGLFDTTGLSGTFHFPTVPVGTHDAVATAAGYGPDTVSAVIESGQTTTITFYLGLPTSVGPDGVELPVNFALRAAYPNPFNPTTSVSFDLPASSTVRLDVFNMLGQRVATLVDGELPAGVHKVSWDASSVGSGVYFARLVAGENVATAKMVLLK